MDWEDVGAHQQGECKEGQVAPPSTPVEVIIMLVAVLAYAIKV